MGASLDFQKIFPFHGNSAWVVLWAALIAWVAFEQPRQWHSQATGHSWLKSVHGISAAAITLFELFHITNHLTGLAGARAHLALNGSLPYGISLSPLEGFLLTAVLVQIVSGFVLLRRRLMTADRFEMLQGAAGAYLLMFFASHLRAVFTARYVHYTNTNWIWLTSSNLLADEWSTRRCLTTFWELLRSAFTVRAVCGMFCFSTVGTPWPMPHFGSSPLRPLSPLCLL
jgi:hypothetical protein